MPGAGAQGQLSDIQHPSPKTDREQVPDGRIYLQPARHHLCNSERVSEMAELRSQDGEREVLGSVADACVGMPTPISL
jgi:hypothetical protein